VCVFVSRLVYKFHLRADLLRAVLFLRSYHYQWSLTGFSKGIVLLFH
jgi:hypothetical protein